MSKYKKSRGPDAGFASISSNLQYTMTVVLTNLTTTSYQKILLSMEFIIYQ